MRIRRLELTNFRTFEHAVFEDLPDTILLVSPNGRGKSSILEAIAGAKDLVAPYHTESYQFKEMWQQKQVSIWPKHLPAPIKIGQHRSEIRLEVESTGTDAAYLRTAGIKEDIGTAHFVIEDGGHITSQTFNEVAKRLFQFHSVGHGVGFVDYIRSVRFYARSDIGNFSERMGDAAFRNSLGDFHRQATEQPKFADFKSFIVSSQLSDFSHEQSTGEKIDSLAEFRRVFDHFFSPKKFVGYRTVGEGGQGQIIVESPFGSHDTDSLSDGEKEMLNVLAYLFRLRKLSNVILWDTPELHLNASLESRLSDAIRRVAPNNQYWIATHSLELINAVPLDNIFVLRQSGNSTVVERASGNERKSRVAIYRDLGAQIGLQLVSAVVVFVEGKDSNSDKRLLDKLVAPLVPGVNFVAGGSCENILAAGTRANRLLEEACSNGDFFAVVDRDYLEDDEVEKLRNSYQGRLFLWAVHEIENVFLEPGILHATLEFLGKLTPEESPESIHQELKNVAQSLKDWIAADWVAWEFDKSFRSPTRRIGGENPEGSLKAYTKELQHRISVATEPSNVESRYEQKKQTIQQLIDHGDWRGRLPGKQLLKKYLERFQTLRPEDYLVAAASLIRERNILLPELDRLRSKLQQIHTDKVT